MVGGEATTYLLVSLELVNAICVGEVRVLMG